MELEPPFLRRVVFPLFAFIGFDFLPSMFCEFPGVLARSPGRLAMRSPGVLAVPAVVERQGRQVARSPGARGAFTRGVSGAYPGRRLVALFQGRRWRVPRTSWRFPRAVVVERAPGVWSVPRAFLAPFPG